MKNNKNFNIDNVDEQKLKVKENKQQLQEMKQELVKQDFKNNMQEYLDKKIDELQQRLVKTNGNLSTIEIKTLLAEKNTVGTSVKFTTTELEYLFEYYKKFIMTINKKKKYTPSKQDFCSFIGISTYTYSQWKQSDDEPRREIMQKIDDYITDLNLSLAQEGELREISTLFRAKTEHGYVEASAPIVIEHKKEVDVNDIMQQIAMVNKGKSLKDIELVQGEDGIYQ